jgi:SSS family solute:Na+ symporter
MHWVDYLIFGIYMLGVLGVGFYHFFRNKDTEDYYVGNRSVKAHHVGLSIVATDVGGGFSIALGGVGFSIGLAGSWMLFSGLVGAWLSAVFIIPRIKKVDVQHGMMTYPDFLRFRYGKTVALLAALISGIGYMGFAGSQMFAGAKLASETILQTNPFGLDPVFFALIAIALITIIYTVFGGLKAVIYTDTIQWVILLVGLICLAIPFSLYEIGGLEAMQAKLPDRLFSLTNLEPVRFFNWMITIMPIWLIAMTLYQRMFACSSVKEAKRAWYIAGFFEYPVMAFTGVFLGMCARVVFPGVDDPEQGLPMLIRDVLPIGITGIVVAAYFSAIMSTADSCMMASSGNFVNDLIERSLPFKLKDKTSMALSMFATLVIGTMAFILAANAKNVIDAIMLAYAFMAAGLFVPTLGAFFWKRASSTGAMAGMLAGGGVTLALIITGFAGGSQWLQERAAEPDMHPTWSYLLDLLLWWHDLGLETTFYGMIVCAVFFVGGSLLFPDPQPPGAEDFDPTEPITQEEEKELEEDHP